LPLLNPTREIVATAVGVSSGYVDAARRLTPEQRREVARGKRSLVERKALSVPAPSVEQRLETIVAELGGIGGVIVALNRLNK
jgi:hypothetical protein